MAFQKKKLYVCSFLVLIILIIVILIMFLNKDNYFNLKEDGIRELENFNNSLDYKTIVKYESIISNVKEEKNKDLCNEINDTYFKQKCFIFSEVCQNDSCRVEKLLLGDNISCSDFTTKKYEAWCNSYKYLEMNIELAIENNDTSYCNNLEGDSVEICINSYKLSKGIIDKPE